VAFSTILMLAVWLPAAAARSGDAPVVVKLVPENGARDVPADLSELIVVFDRDMMTDRYSFVGGGASFPRLAGQPSWRDARTCMLPVQLRPGHRYRLGINGGAHQNFVSVDGTPAIAVVWEFTVAGEAITGAAVDRSSPDVQREAYDRLRSIVAERYSHADRLGIDWAARFAGARETLLGAATPRAFAIAAGELLAANRDRHVWFVVGDEIVPGYREPLTDRSFDFRWIRRNVPNFRRRSDVVFTGRTGDDIGYVLIGTWEREAASDLAILPTVLRDLSDTRALVIDARANAGGDEARAREFAARFVDRAGTYARHRWRRPGERDGWTKLQDREIEPVTEGVRYDKPVALLVGGRVMSSSESFVLMMKLDEQCVTVGTRTAGSAGNPQRYDLGNGVVAMVPGWQAFTAAGEPIEGVGLAPDVPVEVGEAERNGDPVLTRALELLRRKPHADGLSAD
jgi:hypothetical protein